MAKLLAGVTLAAVPPILWIGDLLLIVGLVVGYLTGGIFCWTITNRMPKGEFDEEKAADQLQSGLWIRLGSLCLIMGLAAQVSKPFFLTALAGYLIFLFLAFACFIANCLQKKNQK